VIVTEQQFREFLNLKDSDVTEEVIRKVNEMCSRLHRRPIPIELIEYVGGRHVDLNMRPPLKNSTLPYLYQAIVVDGTPYEELGWVGQWLGGENLLDLKETGKYLKFGDRTIVAEIDQRDQLFEYGCKLLAKEELRVSLGIRVILKKELENTISLTDIK